MNQLMNELKRMHALAEEEVERYIGVDLFRYGIACGKEDALFRCISMIASGEWDDPNDTTVVVVDKDEECR